MDTVTGGSMRLLEGSRPLVHTAFVAAVKNAIASGNLRSDTDPIDFLRALVGIFHTTALPGWEPSARRLFDILITGSRSMPTHPPPPPVAQPEKIAKGRIYSFRRRMGRANSVKGAALYFSARSELRLRLVWQSFSPENRTQRLFAFATR